MDKPITLIVAAPPGGTNDAVGRFLAEGLVALTQRPFVVDNKPGSSGSIGWSLAAKAPPDGSVLTVTSSALAINPATMKRQPFDTLKDLAGVAGLAQSPLILVAHTQFPVQSARDLTVMLQRGPSKVTFACGDSAGLLATTQILSTVGAKAPIVNYKGTGPAMTDVAGGHVALSVTSIASVLPFLKGGQIKALGLLSGTRLKALPDAPPHWGSKAWMWSSSIGWPSMHPPRSAGPSSTSSPRTCNGSSLVLHSSPGWKASSRRRCTRATGAGCVRRAVDQANGLVGGCGRPAAGVTMANRIATLRKPHMKAYVVALISVHDLEKYKPCIPDRGSLRQGRALRRAGRGDPCPRGLEGDAEKS